MLILPPHIAGSEAADCSASAAAYSFLNRSTNSSSNLPDAEHGDKSSAHGPEMLLKESF